MVGLASGGLERLARSSKRIEQVRMAVRGVADEMFSLDAPETMREERPSFRKKSSSVPPTVSVGRIVRAEDGLLVIEIVVEDDETFTVPEDRTRVTIHCEGGKKLRGRLDAKLGTRPGEYGEGLTVRLAVRARSLPRWKAERIEWTDEDGETIVIAVEHDSNEERE